MATECYSQLGFGFQPKLVVDFAGGTLTTDAGLLLVREFDAQLRLSADVVSRIADTRDARYITHELDALVRQPALLNVTSSRPNASTVLSRAALPSESCRSFKTRTSLRPAKKPHGASLEVRPCRRGLDGRCGRRGCSEWR
jgi:hypothetical protein